MENPLKIRVRQRWQFSKDGRNYIAEVMRHPNGAIWADIKVKQILVSDGGTYPGEWLEAVYLLNDAGWSYLEGQDNPRR